MRSQTVMHLSKREGCGIGFPRRPLRRLRQNVRRCSETFGGLLLRRGSKFGMNIITTQIIGRFEKACAHGFGWKNDREYCYGFRHLLGIAIRKGRHNIVSAFYQSLDQLVFFFVVPSATSFLSTATEKKQKKAATAWGLIWGVASSCVWRTGVRVRTRHRKGKHPPLRNGIWGGLSRGGRWWYELCFQGVQGSKLGRFLSMA